MPITIALAGNPNSGKSTLFNFLTGSNQYVGNWPGVTVEKKTGIYTEDKNLYITDLPGTYSLSPYTLEEIVSRDYLINEKPDVIIDVIDATNVERNLYLATQLKELGIPLVLAFNKMDKVEKNKDKINIDKIASVLKCEIVEISAIKEKNLDLLMETAKRASKVDRAEEVKIFSPDIEEALLQIEEKVSSIKDKAFRRFLAIKLFEDDENICQNINLSQEEKDLIISLREKAYETYDDDTEGIITDQRYDFLDTALENSVKRGRSGLTMSDKIDKIVTSRILALPIFVGLMTLIYFIAIKLVGGPVTDWVNETLLTDTVGEAIRGGLESVGLSSWLVSLCVDGIFTGVGGVLGFLPIIATLFFLIAILEDVGYMARIAFILDRIFRRFGLSGKSFIPILIGTGCSVPGIIGTRTIENDRDRKMTIMSASFMPCGAKTEIIAMFASIFAGYWWYGPVWYFGGVLAVIITGIILKKTKLFEGDPAPFVMEMPEYHWPNFKNIFRATWDRCKAFIIKAGTIILLSSIVIWFLKNISTSFEFVEFSQGSNSILESLGRKFSVIFASLGFNNWIAAISTVVGLVAKEMVVGVFSMMAGLGEVDAGNPGLTEFIRANFSQVAIISFMFFNQLTIPCFAALGAIKEEMGSYKWLAIAAGYQIIFSYTISLMIYQFGIVLVEGAAPSMGTLVAGLCLVVYLFLLFRPGRNKAKNALEGEQIKI